MRFLELFDEEQATITCVKLRSVEVFNVADSFTLFEERQSNSGKRIRVCRNCLRL